MTGIGVIIVAGGSGTRMGGDLPKQFLQLEGREILVRTVEKFILALPLSRIVVVLPQDEIARWNKIAEKYGLGGTHAVCGGGTTRFGSVKNGLEAIGDCEYIMVHDGVRPLVSAELINFSLRVAREHDTAVPLLEPVDSYRIIDGGYAVPADRALLRAVQTPQVFRADLLRRAYEAGYDPRFTDDASVVEASGVRLTFCEGERRNIKITTPEDMLFAATILRNDENI